MTDIGPWDVVEAIKDMSITAPMTGGRGPYVIARGQRATVEKLITERSSICAVCGDTKGPGLLLVEYPLGQGIAWCPCEWRKIGGSQADHVRWFAEYLKAKPVVPSLPAIFGRPR